MSCFASDNYRDDFILSSRSSKVYAKATWIGEQLYHVCVLSLNFNGDPRCLCFDDAVIVTMRVVLITLVIRGQVIAESLLALLIDEVILVVLVSR